MSIFYAKDSHSEILWTLNKYKVLPMNVLFKKAKPCVTYARFKKIINYLEEKKVIKTKVTHTDRKVKFVYPNTEVWRSLFPNQQMIVKNDSLFHDAIVSKFINLLESKDLVHQFMLPHEYDDYLLDLVKGAEPDFYISDPRTGGFAVEVELTLKSRSRYYEKFSKFLKNKAYFNLLYVTADYNVFISLKKRFEEYCSKLDEDSSNRFQSLFYILYVQNLTTKECLSDPSVEIFNALDKCWHVDTVSCKLINELPKRNQGVANRLYQDQSSFLTT